MDEEFIINDVKLVSYLIHITEHAFFELCGIKQNMRCEHE